MATLGKEVEVCQTRNPMEMSEAHELTQYLSDEEDPLTHQATLQAPKKDESTTAWALSSVARVLQQVHDEPGDEVKVATVVAHLKRLPPHAQAQQLVRLLQETRETFIPKEAVHGIWATVVRTHGPQQRVASPAALQTSKSATIIPILRTRQLESKRKQAACDLQLLQNRILLLQQEETKAWKKITQTHEKAQHVLEQREATCQWQRAKAEHVSERERASRAALKHHTSRKTEARLKQTHAAMQLLAQKHQQVQQMRTESQRLKSERARLHTCEIERARATRHAIRRQHDALKTKKLRERQQLDDNVALRGIKKVIEEERQLQEHRRKVHEMEVTERTLIERLQGTQLIQRQAYSQLEQALLRKDLKRAQAVAPLTERGDR